MQEILNIRINLEQTQGSLSMGKVTGDVVYRKEVVAEDEEW
jgi:hypothetical protein